MQWPANSMWRLPRAVTFSALRCHDSDFEV
jgi:hypothetical protein